MIKKVKKSLKKEKTIEQLIREKMDYWQSALFLHGWTFNVCFSKDPKDNIAAETSANSAYRQATITFYPISGHDLDDLDETVAHEMMHCVLSRYQELAQQRAVSKSEMMDALEDTVTSLSRIALCLDKKYKR